MSTAWILDRLVALEKRVSALEKNQPGAGAPAATAKAHRIPPDWTPTEDTKAWAQEKFPTVNEGHELEKFKDYWLAKGEPRRDWQAAYRNWIRKAAEFATARPSRGHGGSSSRTAVIDQTNRERADRVASKLAQVQPRPSRR